MLKRLRIILWILFGTITACASGVTPAPTVPAAPQATPTVPAAPQATPTDAPQPAGLTVQPGQAAFLNAYADW